MFQKVPEDKKKKKIKLSIQKITLNINSTVNIHVLILSRFQNSSSRQILLPEQKFSPKENKISLSLTFIISHKTSKAE